MRLIDGVKDLVALYHDYKTMNKDEKADFYQAKCDYYQKYVELSLIAGCFSSIAYIISDYLLYAHTDPQVLNPWIHGNLLCGDSLFQEPRSDGIYGLFSWPRHGNRHHLGHLSSGDQDPCQ